MSLLLVICLSLSSVCLLVCLSACLSPTSDSSDDRRVLGGHRRSGVQPGGVHGQDQDQQEPHSHQGQGEEQGREVRHHGGGVYAT